jgi:hypothetical protein
MSDSAEHPEHHTRKSHHSLDRDRPKHSGKVNVTRHGPRKDGFGKGNTGVAGEGEEGVEVLDPRDPDFEGEEEEPEKPAPK